MSHNAAAHNAAAHNAAAHNAAHDMFSADAASHALGIELIEAAEGSAVTRMRVTAAKVDGHGIGHGGYVFRLADTAFAGACNSYGPIAVVAGAGITFVTFARLGGVLTARAVERTRYGRSGIYDVAVLRSGEMVAEFRGRGRVVGT